MIAFLKLKKWWSDKFRPAKPTRGEELLALAIARDARVAKVHQQLSVYQNRNHIAEQLQMVFDLGRKRDDE